jgi:hypothetical protein
MSFLFPFLDSTYVWIEQVGNQVGSSNADNPAFSPVLYDPNAAAGSRFSATGISSTIARIYHSTASLTPNGTILVGKCFHGLFICGRVY